MNESIELSETIAEEKEKKMSYLKVNVKELETSKEVFNMQLLHQRGETTELSVKLKIEIDSGNKLKILSKENQDEVTRLNESREISKAMIVTEKNRFICSTKTISCLKEDIKELETSKDVLVKQLLQQRHENFELSRKLKTEIDSGNKLKMLSKKNQDEVTRLNESRDLLIGIEEEIPHQQKSDTPTQKITASKVTPTEKVQSKKKTDTQKPDKEIDNKQISVGTRLSIFWKKDKNLTHAR